MAFRAKDGRAFGRRDQMNAYNDRQTNRITDKNASSKDADPEDEREGPETREHGGSLEPKPHQAPEEVRTQERRGENPAGNPNPGPREPKGGSDPDPGITEPDHRDLNPGPATDVGSNPGDTPDDISDFVSQHGPAEHIEIRHSGGLHQVTTTHSGGSKHVSTHPTPHSAHLHAADAAGLNQAMAEQMASPEAEDQIPGMRRSA